MTGRRPTDPRLGRPQTPRRDRRAEILATTLERTQPVRPAVPGHIERRTHDDHRHGTTTLFAALEVATGRVTDPCQPRHRHTELLAFLNVVAKAYPRRQLHVVLDNYATHKHAKVQAWLAATRGPAAPHPDRWLLAEPGRGVLRHPRTPGPAPRRVRQRADLVAPIGRLCHGWNQRCQPFAWTKDTDQILAKLNSGNTTATSDHKGDIPERWPKRRSRPT